MQINSLIIIDKRKCSFSICSLSSKHRNANVLPVAASDVDALSAVASTVGMLSTAAAAAAVGLQLLLSAVVSTVAWLSPAAPAVD